MTKLLNRDEAYDAMLDGSKITHESFCDGDFVHMPMNCILNQDGVNFEKQFYAHNFLAYGWFVI